MTLRFVVAMTGMDPDRFLTWGPADSNDPEAVAILDRCYAAALEVYYPVEMFDLDPKEGLAELREWAEFYADETEVTS